MNILEEAKKILKKSESFHDDFAKMKKYFLCEFQNFIMNVNGIKKYFLMFC